MTDPNATVRRRDLPRVDSAPKAPEPRRRLALPSLSGGRSLAAGLASVRRWPSLLGRWWAPYRESLAPVIARVRLILAAVTPLGWTILALAGLGWIVAVRFGWLEFSVAATALLVLFLICCLFTIGRMNLAVSLSVEPQRVVVGGAVAGEIQVTNLSSVPLLPLGLECPVGAAVARYTLPPLAPNGDHDEVMVIPTSRRGVVAIGPCTTSRGDPFGIVRREVTWTDRLELFVHPRTVPLEPVGSGLLRDLEGHTTNDISMSDLAFHTLREYAPGDDRRYIHWRSSAKASAASGGGKFLVRQFLDTRRSHIAVVTDVNSAAYSSDSEFELAISVGASIALRALADEMDLTVLCGDHAASQPPPHQALDTYSRADFGSVTLPAAVGKLTMLAPDASVVVLVSGARCDLGTLQQARAYLPHEVNVFALTVVEGGQMTLRQAGSLTLLTVGQLADLPHVLRGGQIQ